MTRKAKKSAPSRREVIKYLMCNLLPRPKLAEKEEKETTKLIIVDKSSNSTKIYSPRDLWIF